MLELVTLGGLEVRIGGVPAHGLGGKAGALLVYLACTRRPHSREVLAELLWNEREEGRARANLRVLLTRMPRAAAPHLRVTRETVAFDPAPAFRLDLDEFERHIHEAWTPGPGPDALPDQNVRHLEAAVGLYRGPFMQGFSLHDAPGFEGWMLAEQERLQRQVVVALNTLVAARLARGEYSAGIVAATRLLDLDPLNEEVQRQLMRLLVAHGQRGSALRQYDVYRQRLDKELGVEPEPQTAALVEQIRAGELSAASAGPKIRRPPAAADPVGELPRSTTPFVGREAELVELQARLQDPACRLVTVVGPGGSGKTRLALEAVKHAELAVPDGVFFIPLVNQVDSPGVLGAVMEAVGLPPGHGEQAHAEVLDWLREKNLLLLLDSFEHLSVAVGLLVTLLQSAPGVKLLVTSREPLHLSGEWLFDVGGLDLPATDSVTEIAASAAVRLFVQSARRVQARFMLSEANTAEVVRICRLVDGSPLGIELAAAWVRVQDCGTIARRIEGDLDFLTSPMRDVPERHRSMRAVFEHSWALLSGPEREGLRRLAVFRGSFDLEAAREVASVTPQVLAALVDRSLLSQVAGARYLLHDLLRQFAEEKLRAVPEEHEALYFRHHAYYQRFTARMSLDPRPLLPSDWWGRYQPEQDNVRAALKPAPKPAPEIVTPVPVREGSYAIHLTTSVMIDRSLEEVFLFVADLENDPRWCRYSAILEARYTTPRPIGVGTTVRFIIKTLLGQFESEAVVTHYAPGDKICYRSTSGQLPYRSCRVFEAVGGSTRLTRVDEFDPRHAFRIVAWAVAQGARRALELELQQLKTLLETGATGNQVA